MADQRITTFSPELSRLIAEHVRAELGKQSGATPTNNPVNERLRVTRRTWAKITGSVKDVSGNWLHAWTEQRLNRTTRMFEDVPDGRTGTTTVNYVVNGNNPKEQIATDRNVPVDLAEDAVTGENCWVADVYTVLRKGVVTAADDCEGYVMATYQERNWKVFLTYPESNVYNKGVEVGDDILFLSLPDYDEVNPEGIAVGAEVDYVGLLVDDEPRITKIRNVNVINEHGPTNREDFHDANLAMITDLACPTQVDLGLNWNGIDVYGYPATLKQIRVFDFVGADSNPGEIPPTDLLCVRFKTEKPTGAAGDDSGIVAKVSATVPALKVLATQAGKWLEVSDGNCSNTNQEISHIGPDADNATSTVAPISISIEGCVITVVPPKAKVDETGHFCGWEAGSLGDAVTAEIPTEDIEIPNITGGTISNCTLTFTYGSPFVFKAISCS